jgi:hypothetical protein
MNEHAADFPMPVRCERTDHVLTVIHSRPEVRNAVGPEHAEALYRAFVELGADVGPSIYSRACPIRPPALEWEWESGDGVFRQEGGGRRRTSWCLSRSGLTAIDFSRRRDDTRTRTSEGRAPGRCGDWLRPNRHPGQ